MDDEILGCGGTIAKHVSQGDEVSVLYICSKQSVRFDNEILELRKTHARKVADSLQVKKIYFADLPLIMLDTVPQLDVVTAVEKVMYEVKPEILYCHYWDDINSDHRVVFESTAVWCRPSKTPFLKKVYLYEIFGSTSNFIPNHYVDIGEQLEAKLNALSLYSTEIAAQTRSIETTRTVAKYRGAEINANYAEAFVLYRGIS
jgi:LmbE family N-acetylglucosaminyl deacetylase